MAYPALQTGLTTPSSFTSSTGTHTLTIPTVLVNDLILIVFDCTAATSGTVANIGTNLGTFQRPYSGQVLATTQVYGIFWKYSDGTESGGSTTITLANASLMNRGLSTVYVIRGSHYSKPPVFQVALTSSGYDAPSVTASWGAAENLFMSIIAQASSAPPTLSAYPTGYSNGQNSKITSAGLIAQATKQSSSATDDPSAFNVGAAGGSFANISVAIGPAPAATITAINGGAPVKFGQTGIVIDLAGYGGTPTSVTCTYESGAKSLTCSNITGSSSSITYDLEDRSNGVDYPLDAATLRFTAVYSTDTAYMDIPASRKTGETNITYILPIFDDDDYLGYYFNQDGFTVEGAEFNHIPYGDLVVRPDSGYDTTTGGTLTGWFRPVTGVGAGNVYYYEFAINDAGEIVNGGLTARGLTVSGLTTSGLTTRGL